MPEIRALKKAARAGKFKNSETKTLAELASKIILSRAPQLTGIRSKKENFIASSRLALTKSPPEMDEPERDMPGMRAKAWNTPTTNPLTGVMPEVLPAYFLFKKSAKNIIRLPIIRAIATEVPERNAFSI